MTAEYAADIVAWRYPAPYDCYNTTCVDPGFLVDSASGFSALVDEGGLIGFRSFGPAGRVPGGVYDSSALDTGGGPRPELTGRAHGSSRTQGHWLHQSHAVECVTRHLWGGGQGGAGGGRPVPVKCPSISPMRYCMRLRRFFTAAVSSLAVRTARLPRLVFIVDQTFSTGFSSGA
ncbi:hypothetical protein SAMN05421748_122182 [Paractinoplanes atraurantiacus]|uniref:Uncharacterized protein n=1 Tax=Paractinoplanes atraurantiacus TaxID=1036182 RepID=A0A285JMI5_9ACTN|nr:hypothetical protein SAMN05421748_122182 [Actinoplanes atraurantiacus]